MHLFHEMEDSAQLVDATPDVGDDRGERALPFRRVLVAVESLAHSANTLALAVRMGQASAGQLRLVHLRAWGPPAPGLARMSPQTSEATKTVAAAVSYVGAHGVQASGVILDVPRTQVGSAILAEAASWGADAIVLTARPWRVLGLVVWEKAAREVMRSATCQVLLVYPSR
jgi:nucleotide-binding universal stress UspA family protein